MARKVQLAANLRELPFRKGAARILTPLVRAVFAHEEDTRAGDPEAGVHDMRVATKRLREALRLFLPALRKKDARKHLAWVEEINDALGEVREVDVLVKKLGKRAAALGEPEGLAALMARMERRRDGARSWLNFLLDRVRDRARAAKLEARLARAAAAGDTSDRLLEGFAIEAILERLEGVERRWEKVRLDAREKTLHRVRIANKRLRYAIEPFRAWMPEEVLDGYRVSGKLHDALGDLHDEDVVAHLLETELCCAIPAERGRWDRLARDSQTRRRRHLARTLKVADLLLGGAWSRMREALLAMKAEGTTPVSAAAGTATPTVEKDPATTDPVPPESEPTRH